MTPIPTPHPPSRAEDPRARARAVHENARQHLARLRAAPNALQPEAPAALRPESPAALRPEAPEALRPEAPEALRPEVGFPACSPDPQPGTVIHLHPSDLGRLPGAGPGLVWMLGQCGITTLADLARAEPEELRQRLGLVGQLIDLAAWQDIARGA